MCMHIYVILVLLANHPECKSTPSSDMIGSCMPVVVEQGIFRMWLHSIEFRFYSQQYLLVHMSVHFLFFHAD